jgi:hypothetical protein
VARGTCVLRPTSELGRSTRRPSPSGVLHLGPRTLDTRSCIPSRTFRTSCGWRSSRASLLRALRPRAPLVRWFRRRARSRALRSSPATRSLVPPCPLMPTTDQTVAGSRSQGRGSNDRGIPVARSPGAGAVASALRNDVKDQCARSGDGAGTTLRPAVPADSGHEITAPHGENAPNWLYGPPHPDPLPPTGERGNGATGERGRNSALNRGEGNGVLRQRRFARGDGVQGAVDAGGTVMCAASMSVGMNWRSTSSRMSRWRSRIPASSPMSAIFCISESSGVSMR